MSHDEGQCSFPLFPSAYLEHIQKALLHSRQLIGNASVQHVLHLQWFVGSRQNGASVTVAAAAAQQSGWHTALRNSGSGSQGRTARLT